MKILGIETSCDDIGISIYNSNYGIVFNKKYSQYKIHKKYGGIVPNFASKNHLKKIHNLTKYCIKKYNINLNKIDYISCTAGPGLFGSLLIGTCFSKSLSYSLNIPCYYINHLEGHLFSPLINKNINIKKIFPIIGLIISGGNTQLIKSNKIGNYTIIGKTLDDSIGNFLDKIGKCLNLKYPGGPEIYKISKYGISGIYNFPKPMINSNNFNFSFSGLKTYIINLIKNIGKNINYQIKANISLEILKTIIEILIKKSYLSLKKYKINTLLVSGGVSSNKLIRSKFLYFFRKKNIKVIFPKLEFCTDNAAMIAYICYLKIQNNNVNNFSNKLEIIINSKWSIENNIE